MHRLDLKTVGFLIVPPLMWAGNAVVGRMMVGLMPPVAMNAVRWVIVGLMLAPLAWRLRTQWPLIRARWPYLALIGALGVGSYNALQYLALKTSTPLNVTLIGSSVPVWMMAVGALCFGQHVTRRQLSGALLCIAGVVLVIAQGRWQTLVHVRWVPGDLLMLLAALCWAFYSWLLVRPPAHMQGEARPDWSWAEFLWLQVLFGTVWGALCSVAEYAFLPSVPGAAPVLTGASVWQAWPEWLRLTVGLLFVAVGHSIWAYRSWGRGVQAVGPTVAAFFSNLTPIFAGLLSALLLGQTPSWYHPCALALIVGGIVLSSTRARA